MIDLTDYRKEFGRFCSGWERARYETRGGNDTASEIERATERFTHLFERDTVLELLERISSTENITETERTARRALAGAAANIYLDRRLHEYREECRRCESASRVDWLGERLELTSIPARLAEMAERSERIELERRWLRGIRNCAEPRLALIEARDDAARGLGFTSLTDFAASTREIDLGQWARFASGFLEQTETGYFRALARLRARNDELPTGGDAEYSDRLRWRRLSRFDRIFNDTDLGPALKQALGWMSIDLDRQPNLQLEFEPSSIGDAPATLFCVQPPSDVRLWLKTGDGAVRYRQSFQAMGMAQQQTWSSPGLFERYPEFVYPSDRATAFGSGELFANLHLDRSWVAELYTRGNEATAAELVAEFALLGLSRVRAHCAKLLFWLEHPTVESLSANTTESGYAERMRGATGFAGGGTTHLGEANGAIGWADRLRAVMFEMLLLDHFRSNYGNRWWSARRASDELRDIWNTGSRYSVEELATSLRLGEIAFEPTADRFRGLIDRH
jgi:hypothetical protein